MGDGTRVRFAPSPTGYLHVGNARTALFSWLHARHTGGVFILRLEDTDVARSTVEAETALMADLKWLGLHWDEGPDCGGPFAPYRQSERLALYREVAESILRSGKAYRCYCTDEELEVRRKQALAAGRPPHYDRRCLGLSAQEIARYEAEGRRASLRFVVEYHEVVVNDIVRGEVRFRSGMVGDFIMLRSDGMPTYNFACVVDDWKMEISHVIRGEEHLSNTLRQCLLYEHLGITPPAFAHLPLVLGPDREKLSKRHGAVSVGDLRRLGYPPDAVVNHLALLGWSPGEEGDVMARGEIVERFRLERVSRSPSVFDTDKLDWITSHYIKTMPTEELVAGMLPFLEARGQAGADRELLSRVASALRDTGKKLPELAEEAGLFLRGDQPLPPDLAERISSPGAAKALSMFREALGRLEHVDKASVSQLLAGLVKDSGLKKGEFFMPLRIALTGAVRGPEIPLVVEVLGKHRAVELLGRVPAGPGGRAAN
jgi:nondiscriminating glutamyl-tRNA synthetase